MNHIAVNIGEVLGDMYPNRQMIGEVFANSAYVSLLYSNTIRIEI